MGVGGVGDERLTDERLIDLLVKHDRLGREAQELGRLIAAHKEMIGAAEGGAAPRRASSLAEYNRLTTESRSAAELARSKIGEVRAREANLRRAQGEILRDLAASGMPEEVWVRHGDEGVLLAIGERGEASLRRALWEARSRGRRRGRARGRSRRSPGGSRPDATAPRPHGRRPSSQGVSPRPRRSPASSPSTDTWTPPGQDPRSPSSRACSSRARSSSSARDRPRTDPRPREGNRDANEIPSTRATRRSHAVREPRGLVDGTR